MNLNISSKIIPKLPSIFVYLFSCCHSIVISQFGQQFSSDLVQAISYFQLEPYIEFLYRNNQSDLFQQFFELLFEREIDNEGQAAQNTLDFILKAFNIF
jgi:hypothetical protein